MMLKLLSCTFVNLLSKTVEVQQRLLYNPTPKSQDHHGGSAQVEKVSH